MNRRHRALMDELASAKPQVTRSPEEWTATEAERLLARIHEQIERETQAVPTRRTGRFRRPLVVWAAVGAVAVAAIALLLSLWVVPSLTGPAQVVVAPSTSTTSSTATGITAVQTVTKEESLRALTELYEEHPAAGHGVPSQDPSSALELAQRLGIVRESELEPTSIGRPTTRGEFALWTWRAWSQVLPGFDAPPSISDMSALSTEEAQAVRAAVGLGILSLDQKGAFHAGDSLAAEDQRNALARLRGLLER